VAPDVRFSLDYLEDKISLVANSMRKMQENINTRSDDLISKDELEWLFIHSTNSSSGYKGRQWIGSGATLTITMPGKCHLRP
jgi:hypothetical protein